MWLRLHIRRAILMSLLPLEQRWNTATVHDHQDWGCKTRSSESKKLKLRVLLLTVIVQLSNQGKQVGCRLNLHTVHYSELNKCCCAIVSCDMEIKPEKEENPKHCDCHHLSNYDLSDQSHLKDLENLKRFLNQDHHRIRLRWILSFLIVTSLVLKLPSIWKLQRRTRKEKSLTLEARCLWHEIYVYFFEFVTGIIVPKQS